MALAYSIVKKGVIGNMRMNIVDLTLDGSYAAGGYTISASSCGVGTIHQVTADLSTAQNGTHGLVTSFDPATGKLKIFKSGTAGAQLNELGTNDTLIGTSSKVRCLIFGDAASG